MPYEKIEREYKIVDKLLDISIINWLLDFILNDVSQKRAKHKQEREKYKAEYDSFKEEFINKIRIIENDLDKINNYQLSIKDKKLIKKKIENIFKDIKFEVSYFTENKDYLYENEYNYLNESEKVLTEYKNRLEKKFKIETFIADVKSDIDNLKKENKFLMSFSQYLTTNKKEKIKMELEKINKKIEYLENESDFSLKSGQNNLTNLLNDFSKMKDRVNNYNQKFISEQEEKYRNLFFDIDEAGHDMMPSQREAIIRNDNVNQLIAAAGTGKTLVLTYRIAYLVKEGILPEKIIALTFTKEAAREMGERLKDRFEIEDVKTSTLHAFGYQILKDSLPKNKKLEPCSESDLIDLISDQIDNTRNDIKESNEFTKHYHKYLIYHKHNEFKPDEDFDKKEDYTADKKEKLYKTLEGEEVASLDEKEIADFLFLNQIKYRHEQPADWAKGAEDKNIYRPDFYLPEYDLYIEHWGIDRVGEVADWFEWSSEEYQNKMNWAKTEFKRTDKDLVETFHYEYKEEVLLENLKKRLIKRNVKLDKLSHQDFIERVFDYNQEEKKIKEKLKEFVVNAKTHGIRPEEIEEKIDSDSPRQYHFAKCGLIIYQMYNQFLEDTGMIDFNDMINKAAKVIKENPEKFRGKFDHILVDEFQDVSISQINLVKSLLEATGANLFCVGDDWQSIYSFQGSEVRYFINMEEHFGKATKTYLTKNFRCPKEILSAGNELIENNEAQIEKEVEAVSGRTTQPKLHLLDGFKDKVYQNNVRAYTADLVEEYLNTGSQPSDIMVLCRYDGAAPYLKKVKEELKRRDISYEGKDDKYPYDLEEGEGVDVYSVHQSKGREAEHVILVHTVEGEAYSFPAEEKEDELLALVKNNETNIIAEERRLFYVAITRVEKTLDIISKSGSRSRFIEEIEDFLEVKKGVANPGKKGDRIEIRVWVNYLSDNTSDKIKQKGFLKDKTGSRLFVSWANSAFPKLEEKTRYRLKNVKVNEYNGDKQFVLDDKTEVVKIYQH